jgi:hypothetical protein
MQPEEITTRRIMVVGCSYSIVAKGHLPNKSGSAYCQLPFFLAPSLPQNGSNDGVPPNPLNNKKLLETKEQGSQVDDSGTRGPVKPHLRKGHAVTI